MTSPASGADSAPDLPANASIPRSALGPQSVTGRAASPGATAGGGNRRLGLALLVIATAQLMVVLDATIVNVALPHVQRALGFSGTGLEWVVNAYAITFGVLLLLGGRAGDILGRRRVFVFGLLLFSAASLLGGFATHSRPVPEKPSARWMCGRATFTMVPSSTTMSWALAMTSRARPRRRLPPPAVAPGEAARPVSDCADRVVGA